jgi:amiloride-sensitive sodium channel
MINQKHLPSIPPNKYPLKVDTNGKFGFLLKLSKPDYNETTHGFCIPASFFIHQPNYFPTFQDRLNFVDIRYGTTMNVEVTPEIVKTDAILRKLEPSVRECYFEGERQLKYFNAYSLDNCEIECFTNATLNWCGCVSLNQPYLTTYSIEHCLTANFAICSNVSKKRFLNFASFSIERNCSCLPTCDSTSYHLKYHAEQNNDNATIINVRMTTDELIIYYRYQQFTLSDEISYVGGLLGLFAGISMLSIVEVAYFFTLRMLVDLWRAFFVRNH